MKRLSLLIALLLATGCSKVCRPGTVLLEFSFPDAQPTTGKLTVETNQGSVTRDLPVVRSEGSVEVVFPAGYPRGQSVRFILVFFDSAGSILLGREVTRTLVDGCQVIDFRDSSTPDFSSVDSNGADSAVDQSHPADLSEPPNDSGGDFSASDMGKLGDMAEDVPPSCVGLPATCGAMSSDSCCLTLAVPGGTFNRSNDVGSDDEFPTTTDTATVGAFKLDKYEVTVGRFRKFVEAGKGLQTSAPSAGAGAHSAISGSGWIASWNSNLSADTPALVASLKCNSGFQTWMDTAGATEKMPINCLNWYQAMAFCIWDGGYLPTEAEWNFAAAGGSEQRAFPWSTPPSNIAIDATYASYADALSNITTVGALVKGEGKWLHSELAGNVREWTLDWYPATGSSYPNPCVDCANLTDATKRTSRGGGFGDPARSVRGAYRMSADPATGNINQGVRCARPN